MLAKMVEEPGEEGRRTRLEAARLMAILPDTFERELRTLLDDEDVEVARTAIAAVGALKKRSMIGTLLDRLAEPALNESSVAALAKFGDRIVGTLRDYLIDPDMRPEVRREIPKVLQEIGTTAAQTVLVESILDRDVVLRYHTISAINRLGQAHPGRSTDRKLIETVLAAEIMGHYRSYQVLGTLGGDGRSVQPGRARAARIDGEGDGAHLPAAEDPVSAVRPAQRLRRHAVRRSRRARQRGGVHGFGAAAGSALADHSAVRSQRDGGRSASPPPIG